MISSERIREIEVVLDAVRIALHRCPTLRVGQLIDNATFKELGRPGPDLFNISDGALAGRLLDYAK